jgi:son of sevenless
MYLKDLTFIEDGNQDYITNNNLINFNKKIQLSNILLKIKEYQNTNYNFEAIDYIQKYFGSMKPENMLNEDKMWENSLKM